MASLFDVVSGSLRRSFEYSPTLFIVMCYQLVAFLYVIAPEPFDGSVAEYQQHWRTTLTHELVHFVIFIVLSGFKRTRKMYLMVSNGEEDIAVSINLQHLVVLYLSWYFEVWQNVKSVVALITFIVTCMCFPKEIAQVDQMLFVTFVIMYAVCALLALFNSV